MASNSNLNAIGANDPVIVANGGTGLATITDHGVMIGSGTGAVTPLAVGTNGQVIVGSTGADPAFATLTSTDGTITYTTGAGSLNVASASKIITATVPLSNAQIKAIHATPITVVAAPAAGSFVNVISVSAKMTYGGTNAFTNTSGTNLGLFYTNNAGLNIVANALSNAAITATESRLQATNVTGLTLGTATVAGMEAVPVVITATSATEIAGNAANNNTMTFSVVYQILTL